MRPEIPHSKDANMDLYTVHDESIKNLLMAWYYAGYYQGRYDEKMEAALPKLQTKHKG